MEERLGVRNKQIAKQFSGDLFVPHSESFPMNSEKKTLIPYIDKASNKVSKALAFWSTLL